jgi:hypothetical protein
VRLQALSSTLSLPLELLVDMAARDERLLTMEAGLLRGRLRALAGELGRPYAATAALLARQPSLLCWDEARLRSAAAGLRHALATRGLALEPLLEERPDLLSQVGGERGSGGHEGCVGGWSGVIPGGA